MTMQMALRNFIRWVCDDESLEPDASGIKHPGVLADNTLARLVRLLNHVNFAKVIQGADTRTREGGGGKNTGTKDRVRENTRARERERARAGTREKECAHHRCRVVRLIG